MAKAESTTTNSATCGLVFAMYYKKKLQDRTQNTGYCQMVQKMVQVKQEMASQIKKRGEPCIFKKVREIVETVCRILIQTTDIVKVPTSNTELRDVELLCPAITHEYTQTRVQTHFTNARGIHILHSENNSKVLDTQNIVLPARIYATLEDRHNILEAALVSRFSTERIVAWQRKNVLISFLHIIWSIFGGEYK